jgi:hypothetical protein
MQTEEQLVRKWVRQILKESSPRRLVEQEGDLTKAFITPFTDVFKTAQVSFKNLLTDLKFTWDMLVTFDPIKLANMRSNYKKRKETIAAERKKIMEPTMKALGGDDLKLAAMLLAPGAYLGAQAVASAWSNKGNVMDYFREAGFGDPSKGETGGAGGAGGAGGIQKPVGVVGTAMKALKKLFFIETQKISGLLITEQKKEEGGEKGAGNKEAVIIDALRELGAVEDLQKGADDLLKMTKESIDEMVDLFKPSAEIISKIGAAQNMEELLDATAAASAAGLDLGGTNQSQIKSGMEKQVDEFLGDEKKKADFVKSLAEREGTKPDEEGNVPEIPDDKLRTEAEKVFYVNSSQSIRDGMAESREKLQEQFIESLEALKEEIGLDEESMKMITKTSAGKKLLDLFEDAERELNV